MKCKATVIIIIVCLACLIFLFQSSHSTIYGNWNVGPNWIIGANWGIAALVGDVNGDGVVDIFDALLIAQAFDSIPSSPNWNVNADINIDGRVSLADGVLLTVHYGDHY